MGDKIAAFAHAAVRTSIGKRYQRREAAQVNFSASADRPYDNWTLARRCFSRRSTRCAAARTWMPLADLAQRPCAGRYRPLAPNQNALRHVASL